MNVTWLYRIHLEAGESIVSVTAYRDYLIAITNTGSIYRLEGVY